MIEISELQPAADASGWAFTATIDGQRIEGCQYASLLARKLWIPQTAASIVWGDHTLADVEATAKLEIDKVGEPHNV